MQHNTQFSVRYLTDGPVPIRDIISSLQAVETTINETARLLPSFIDGLSITKVEIKVREIAQESPLREAFAVALMMAYQDKLRVEVPHAISDATGILIPERFDTIVTVVALIVVFYGAEALKDLVLGKGGAGAAAAQFNGLVAELSEQTGKSEDAIRKVLKERYGEKTMWRRLANATSRFFAPSKQQDSAPIEFNGRQLTQDVVRDVPAEYLVEDAADEHPTRNFNGVAIELHAQDKDHAGRGWAAVVAVVSDQRLRMKLMDEVSAADLWGNDQVNGDITVVYEKIGSNLLPREIHLHRVRGTGSG